MVDRWLTDDSGALRHDVALSVLEGGYTRGVVVCYRQLRLSPARDRVPLYAVDTADGRQIDCLNAGAVRTGSELVDILDEMHEHQEV